ncbi:MAG: sugar phosphate nucleotidyltransferase [bacterium]|nr:sugar phosphate nucleotidyltransferase [bacterium]
MEVTVIILAAGLGKRMKQNYPKVLTKLAGKELIKYVLETVSQIGRSDIIAVIGFKGELVKDAVTPNFPGVKFALQAEQLGTGHAVMCTREMIPENTTDILVLCGDTPLITSESLINLIQLHIESSSKATILTADLPDPTGYGRIIRDGDGGVVGIVEQADATEEQRMIKEINSGVYIFKKEALLPNLDKLTSNNSQGEYYLTDIIRILFNSGEKISGLKAGDFHEILGVNTKEHLESLEEIIRGQR